MKGEKQIMPTKLLEKEATLPASELRKMSQKDLIRRVSGTEKLGVIANNHVALALLSWDKYENIVDLLTTKDQLIFDLENQIEDMLLANSYGKDVINIERGQQKSYNVDSIDEVFAMIDLDR